MASTNRPWMKIIGTAILVVILVNIAVVVFYFGNNQGKKNTNRRFKRGDNIRNFKDLFFSWDQTTRRFLTGNHSGGSDGTNLNRDGRGPSEDTERGEGSAGKLDKKTQKSSLPVILWWDPISGMRDEVIHCGQYLCDVTVNRQRWPEEDVMVLSFYGTDLSMNHMPVPRRDNDLWALFHDESPKNLDYLFSHRAVMELFNYTSTFRDHSHLPIPTQWLGDVKELTSDEYVVPVSVKSQLRKTENLAPVVYVQSDCQVPSDRDHFVQLLQQFVAVDSYGACLNNKRFPSRSLDFGSAGMAAMTDEQFYQFLARYKFIIAIENAVCPGYITEKLWRSLRLGVVPIVFGAPNIKEFLPTKSSALVVTDYNSVETLAQTIKSYDSDDQLYNGLLQHKQGGITNPTLMKHLDQRPSTSNYRVRMVQDYQCMLCEKLHQAKAAHQAGQPLPHSVADTNHYGCPKPGRFNEHGQYVESDSSHWEVPWYRSKAMACVMRNLMQRARPVPQATFDLLVDHTMNTWNSSRCDIYFH